MEDAVSSETTRHLDAVTYLLGKELGDRGNTHTTETLLEDLQAPIATASPEVQRYG
jgi:hypothetical protein